MIIMGVLIHGKGVSCNHIHVHETYDIKQVSCKACKNVLRTDEAAMKKFIEEGNIENFIYNKRIKELDARISGESKSVHGSCPKCLAQLKVRHNRKADSYFLGCSRYPSCTHTAPYNTLKYQ